MNYLNFITSFLSHVDSYLYESIVVGYKTIFESDMNEKNEKIKSDNKSIDDDVAQALIDIQQTIDDGDLVFFHSSDANHMLNGSIEPQCGPWVREVINSATDDDDFIEELIEKSQFVFLSTEPSWIKGKAQRAGGLEHAHVAVILLDRYRWSDSIYQLDTENGRLIDLNGESGGYLEGVGPESGDYFTKDEVPVSYEFTGEKLKQFLAAYSSGKYQIH
jgi:hypothetical protein